MDHQTFSVRITELVKRSNSKVEFLSAAVAPVGKTLAHAKEKCLNKGDTRNSKSAPL